MVGMQLPVMPPVGPMLAKAVQVIPRGGYSYEPKWDGFRCIVFRDGDEVELGSRNERPLTRYFPEVVDAVLANLPRRCVVDGEIVIPVPGRGASTAGPGSPAERLDFEALLQRIHPADSRVRKLAVETPAHFVAFDLLALGDESFLDTPFSRRREVLAQALRAVESPVHLTQVTDDPVTAERWFDQFEGAGLDGIVAKAHDVPYRPDERIMLKVKHERTADCVVAGLRWHKQSTDEQPLVGSLLLGLYDGDRLQHVGVSASFPVKRRAELVEEMAPLRLTEGEEHPWLRWAEAEAHGSDGGRRLPGAQSRWNAGKDLSFVLLRPERVVEVRYDHMEGTRFRHTAQFVRWRHDREPASCTYEQLMEPVSYDLREVLAQ
jgi:ATP-dependent DNA ligase